VKNRDKNGINNRLIILLGLSAPEKGMQGRPLGLSQRFEVLAILVARPRPE